MTRFDGTETDQIGDVPIGVYHATIHGRQQRVGVLFSHDDYAKSGEQIPTPFLRRNQGYVDSYSVKEGYLLTAGDWTHGLWSQLHLEMLRFIMRAPRHARTDPFWTARYVCALICNDDPLVMGKWGSALRHRSATSFPDDMGQVMRAYNRDRPMTGQCFIYSAILCALMRACGIPCRQIVCSSAGHNEDHSKTIDLVFGKRRGHDEDRNDSIWNFHCWTEVYVRGQWHILDGTPQLPTMQEPLKGDYVCGPCPLSELKKKESDALDHNYCRVGTACATNYAVEVQQGWKRRRIEVVYHRLDRHTRVAREGENGHFSFTSEYHQPFDPHLPNRFRIHNRQGELSPEPIPGTLRIFVIGFQTCWNWDRGYDYHPDSIRGFHAAELPVTNRHFVVPRKRCKFTVLVAGYVRPNPYSRNDHLVPVAIAWL